MALNNALSDLIGKVLNDTSNGKSTVTIQILKDNCDIKSKSTVSISVETPKETHISKTPKALITPSSIKVYKEVEAHDNKMVIRQCMRDKTVKYRDYYCNIDNNSVNDDDVNVSGIFDDQMKKQCKFVTDLKDAVGYQMSGNVFTKPENTYDEFKQVTGLTSAPTQTHPENNLILNWSRLIKKTPEIQETVPDTVIDILPVVPEDVISIHSSEYEVMSDPDMLD